MNLKGRHFLTLKDYTPEEIMYLLNLSAEVKRKKKEGIPVDNYRGKNVALIFEKTSTRTRCSFEVAAHDMGMGTTWIRQVPRLERKRALRIPPVCWDASTMVSSTAVLDRRSWRSLRNTQVFRYGMV